MYLDSWLVNMLKKFITKNSIVKKKDSDLDLIRYVSRLLIGLQLCQEIKERNHRDGNLHTQPSIWTEKCIPETFWFSGSVEWKEMFDIWLLDTKPRGPLNHCSEGLLGFWNNPLNRIYPDVTILLNISPFVETKTLSWPTFHLQIWLCWRLICTQEREVTIFSHESHRWTLKLC